MPIYGTDYDTRDGTCIRNYIHIIDIARAHILALNYLRKNRLYKVYNIGNGGSYSVMEVVKATKRITGATIPEKIHPKHPGDPAQLITSPDLAKVDLGWKPR